ncbi:MAG: hypothetical protein ACOC56_05810 [Atribacterota bacterium]
MSDKKITSTRKVLLEKFGFTSNLPNDNERLHDNVTDRNGQDGRNPAYLPVEEFRKEIKLLMGATTTEEDQNLKDILDFRKLRSLFDKYGMTEVEQDLDLLEKAFEKNDKNLISRAWNRIKDKVPYWFLGMLSANQGADKDGSSNYYPKGMTVDNEKLPEQDKAALINLLDVMKKVNDEAEKEGKAAAKNTPEADRDTEASKNLKSVKNKTGIPDKAPHNLNKKPENKIEEK